MNNNIKELRPFSEIDGNLVLAIEPPLCEAPFLDAQVVLSQLTTGDLHTDLLESIIANPRPEYYPVLWELSWKDKGQFRSLLYRAIDRCHWDDPRSTDELLRKARRDPEGDAGKECIKLLQRRGGFEVSKRASFLVERGRREEQLLGLKVLGRLGDRRSFLKSNVLRVLSRALESEDEEVCANAAQNISHWTKLDYSRLVGHAINYHQPLIRNAAKVVLYGMKNPSSLEGLIGLLTAREWALRQEMVQSLKHAVMGLVPPANQILDTPKQQQDAKIYELSHSANISEFPSPIPIVPQRPSVGYGALKAAVMLIVLTTVVMNPGKELAGATHEAITIGLGQPMELGENSAMGPEDSSTYQPTDNPFEAVSLKVLMRGRKMDEVGMVEASRIHRWLQLRERPIRRVLNNSRDSWILYQRMHPQLAASIVAQATVPEVGTQRERLDFRHLLRSLVFDINNGKHDHGSYFLQYLALLNGNLASYIISQASKRVMGITLDDFIVRFGYLDGNTTHSRLFGDLRFHPALTQLTHDTREILIDSLLNGWVTSEERDLAVHLDSLNYPSQLEGRLP